MIVSVTAMYGAMTAMLAMIAPMTGNTMMKDAAKTTLTTMDTLAKPRDTTRTKPKVGRWVTTVNQGRGVGVKVCMTMRPTNHIAKRFAATALVRLPTI